MKNRHSRRGLQSLCIVPSYIWLLVFSLSIFILTIINTKPRMEAYNLEKAKMTFDHQHKDYLIKTENCKIPDFPITNKEIEKYFRYKFSGAHCNQDIPPLVDSNLTCLYVLEESFSHYGVSNKSNFNCCYEELIRKEPKDGQIDNQYKFGDICFIFENSTAVQEEFVHVQCTYNQELIYQDLFAFIPRKSDVTRDPNGEKLRVLIMGIDGVSRINFHRQMKKTAKTLNQLGFQEFLGYNKIADNTYPNLIPVLTGYNEDQILNTCRNTSKYFDNCTLIWDQFKKNKYITSFSEDSAYMGIFNFQKSGFQKQPTDYMWSFFDRISEDLIGNSKSLSVIQCIGAREGYKMIVKYIRDFVHKMNIWELPYFSFSWSASLTHDLINKPRIGDQLYSDFFVELYEKKYFQNTVVIFMSDHGIRYGSFRQTYQGRMEERLPLLFIRLPSEFKKRYPLATSNLRVNLGRLTSPYDLHETLQDLSFPKNLEDDFLHNSIRKTNSEYGMSFFSKIPSSRTCEDAGITDHWCTCLNSHPVPSNAEVVKITNFIMDYLNGLLDGYPQCAKLHLNKIKDAQLLTHPEKSFWYKHHVKDFLVHFETEPGGGSFEATVRKSTGGKMGIVGTVSRLNLYEAQSVCITDFHLKLYCYC